MVQFGYGVYGFAFLYVTVFTKCFVPSLCRPILARLDLGHAVLWSPTFGHSLENVQNKYGVWGVSRVRQLMYASCLLYIDIYICVCVL